jgi:hypothetical protein
MTDPTDLDAVGRAGAMQTRAFFAAAVNGRRGATKSTLVIPASGDP